MNEKNDELLRLLEIMKDLHKNGFYLTKEIEAIIKLILINNGLTKEILYGNKEQLNK